MARGSSSSSPAKSTSSGRETHAPNRFEATREKDPSRVEGGKKAAQTRGQQVHEDDDEPLDQEDIPDSDRHGNDLLGNDFHAGKNPNRQEVSKRVAKERGHDAFVEMGKKGGSTQKGIHAGQINGLDADDMTTYLEHPEVGVPEKNPNRVLGGKKAAQTRGQEVHDMPEGGLNTRDSGKKQEQKDPVRVEAGKKAARTRGLHVRDDDNNDDNEDDEDDDEEEDSDDNQNKNQRGSAQKNKQQNKNYSSTQQKNSQGKNPNRVAGGKQAAKTRGDNVHDDDDDDDDDSNDDNSSSYNSSRSHHDGDYNGKNPNRVEGGKRAASHRSHEDFVEMGKKGSEARIQKHGEQRHTTSGSASKSGRKTQQHDDDDDSESNEQNDRQSGKNPNRVRGGKQAAKTRGDNVHDDEDDSNDDDSNNYNNNNRSHHDGDYNGKNPNRVEGGKRAAANRSHEDFSEMGKKGAEARIQKHGEQRHNTSGSASKSGRKTQQHDDDDEDDDGENDSVSNSQNDRQSGKNPNRVRGGKQAAKTRGDNVQDDGESSSRRRSNSNNSNNHRSKPMKDSDDEDADYDDSRASRESVYSHAGFGLDKAGVRDDGKSARRVVGGQSAALQRGFNVKRGEEETDNGNPNRIQGGLEAASKRSHEDFVEMGKKGGRTQKKQSNDDDMEDDEDYSSSSAKKNGQGKNPNRVAGGKQAAKTRGDNVHDDDDNSDDNNGPSSGTRSHHDGEYEGKNPNRVEGGKKAASHRSHEEMSEIGKKGASARWGKDYTDHSDEKHEYDSGEQSSKSTGNYRSKREADTNIHSPSKRQRQTSAY